MEIFPLFLYQNVHEYCQFDEKISIMFCNYISYTNNSFTQMLESFIISYNDKTFDHHEVHSQKTRFIFHKLCWPLSKCYFFLNKNRLLYI